MLYAENTFRVNIQDGDELTLADLLSSKPRQKIRKMVLILRPGGASYRPRFSMDPDIWDSILGNLQIIAVVVEQPEPAFQEVFEKATPEEGFAKWIAWITPIFEYLCRALDREAKIVVDQLPIADYNFGREKFTSASGFWGGYWGRLEDDPITARDCIDDDDY
ncbi:hypothetical protein TGAM01_v207791 [Trichoderma gamsii]|uniref:Uncharacterized protein n=1 Tax=Trichoderma gamsii TaxID=398673 RepID=A0A2P4ZG37_9HYPO|nr:hypothetical protein TGAM01_v207791 [Trichoderma gamsii]PON23264.1 hypothetical protein TGAM01_v207791 [Trichoderma gamsii]